jgi:Flp pilus assembly protein TadG
MQPQNRRGAAAVETAVCLPLIILVVLGTIETCSIIFLQQSLQNAAYEATRVAAVPEKSTSDGQSVGQQIISQRKIQGGSVTVTETSMVGFGTAKLITATATAPVDSNRVLPAWVISLPTLSARCTMVKEVN